MELVDNMLKTQQFKKIVILLFFALSALLWLASELYSHYYVSTDDAYINANIVQIAPRITGKVSALYISNNQYVKKGQPLFDIDMAPFQATFDSAKAQVTVNEAQLAKAALLAKRTLPLVKRNYLSQQQGDDAVAIFKTALGNLAYTKAGLVQATLNLQYTHVTAPISGWITNLTLRVGNIVPANQSLFLLISDDEFWADANFKETEMQAIKPGQTATIVTDLYPHHPFNGVIESISGGAGAAFSLLPPQNATGNWVKVTQRIPVRIRILHPDAHYQLRVGISANVKVHLKENA